jgi:hypothetical protein
LIERLEDSGFEDEQSAISSKHFSENFGDGTTTTIIVVSISTIISAFYQ